MVWQQKVVEMENGNKAAKVDILRAQNFLGNIFDIILQQHFCFFKWAIFWSEMLTVTLTYVEHGAAATDTKKSE